MKLKFIIAALLTLNLTLTSAAELKTIPIKEFIEILDSKEIESVDLSAFEIKAIDEVELFKISV